MVKKTSRGRAGGAAALLALAALAMALLAGCGSDERGQTVRLTPDPDGSTSVAVRVGDTVVVSLDANATTGYEWQFTAGDTFTLEKSEYVPDPDTEDLAGAGGTQVVTLRVTTAGTSELKGVYVRPWETPSPSPAGEVTVTIMSE